MFKQAAALLLALVAIGTSAQGAVLVDLYDTGVVTNGTPLPDGVNDPHYAVTRTSSPLAGITDVVADSNTYPLPSPWVPNGPNSKWVGVSTNGTSLDYGIDPTTDGTYVWRTTFTVPNDAILASISITGRWATDNPGTNILINGNSTGNTAGGYNQYYGFAINSGFITGVNVLEFLVTNLAFNGQGGNPSGLRVDNMVGTFTAVPETTALVTWGGIMLIGAVVLGKRYGKSLVA